MVYYVIQDRYNPRMITADVEEAQRIAESNPGCTYREVGSIRAWWLNRRIKAIDRSTKDISRVVDSK